MGWILGVFAVLVTGWWVTSTVRAARSVGRSPQAELTAYLARTEAVGTLARVVGLIISLAIWITTPADTPVRSPLASMATLIAAPVVVGVLIIGDRRWPSPTGTVRTASLTARRLRDTVPVAELVLALAATVTLWVTSALGVGGTVGSRVTSDAISLLAVALAVVAIRRVTSRGALVGVDSTADLAFRRLACGRVLRTLAVGFFLAASGWQPLVVNGSAPHVGVGGVVLVAGALLSLFALQGRRPRATSTAESVTSGTRP